MHFSFGCFSILCSRRVLLQIDHFNATHVFVFITQVYCIQIYISLILYVKDGERFAKRWIQWCWACLCVPRVIKASNLWAKSIPRCSKYYIEKIYISTHHEVRGNRDLKRDLIEKCDSAPLKVCKTLLIAECSAMIYKQKEHISEIIAGARWWSMKKWKKVFKTT